jgi:hypothetical protein
MHDMNDATTSSQLSTAIAYLDAYPLADGRYAYRDDATRADWAVTVEQLADLGMRIERDDDDAYSVWCADTVACELA